MKVISWSNQLYLFNFLNNWINCNTKYGKTVHIKIPLTLSTSSTLYTTYLIHTTHQSHICHGFPRHCCGWWPHRCPPSQWRPRTPSPSPRSPGAWPLSPVAPWWSHLDSGLSTLLSRQQRNLILMLAHWKSILHCNNKINWQLSVCHSRSCLFRPRKYRVIIITKSTCM